jgi:hypothetical protein
VLEEGRATTACDRGDRGGLSYTQAVAVNKAAENWVVGMKDRGRHALTWGWLRLFLGMAQMLLVTLSVGSLLISGLHELTWVLILAATASTLASRLLYGGKMR